VLDKVAVLLALVLLALLLLATLLLALPGLPLLALLLLAIILRIVVVILVILLEYSGVSGITIYVTMFIRIITYIGLQRRIGIVGQLCRRCIVLLGLFFF